MFITWFVLYAVFVVWPMSCKSSHVVLLELVLWRYLGTDTGNLGTMNERYNGGQAPVGETALNVSIP